MQEPLHYAPIPSALGEFSIVWRETAEGPTVSRVLLPGEAISSDKTLPKIEAGTSRPSNPAIEELAELMRRYFKGDPLELPMSLIDLGPCSDFQRRVLLAQHKVPRGRVSTYGGIARSLGVPNTARAVGTALAKNPFPVIIPCHRTIRSTGDLGEFGGGVRLKRALLELEGVEFSEIGKVLSGRSYY